MSARAGTKFWLAPAALLFVCAAWANPRQGYGQAQQPPPKPPTQPGQNAQPPAPPAAQVEPPAPAVNVEEEAAYKAYYEKASDVPGAIQLGEEFLSKFPESRYRESVYSRLTSAYLSRGQEEKMFAAGEKVLELNPNNVDVLALMGMVIPRRVNPRALDAEQKFNKAEKYSKQAVALLTEMQKPAGMTDEDFAKAKNDKLSMAHSGLGFVYFQREKYAESAAALVQSTQLAATPDPVDFYLLGICYEQTKRHGEAAAAYGRCSEVTWQLQDRCKQNMEQAKKRAATESSSPKP